MTTTLAAPRAGYIEFSETPITCVLTISGMPVHLRGRVEQLMADILPPAEVETTPGLDIWDVTWFTRWQRDTTTFGARGLRCREVLSAPAAAAEQFASEVQQLARTVGFHAVVDFQ
ncbi:hypothetical protein CCYS_09830 [Corynebacterium cystitidis DSM 20524]|uniref:Uncharacterized protein n=1 Tax=Corynebacterium cystitidis DSM 20524 TaxID=1121357 RepID=A0A1H9VNX3_9CORY|nr:hypothetical protein CCYS_09830 [Corynebacterium cystitidis DSM 20524]SES23244.1 hypothetical protein SAMN05661109_02323 [Corynebacterium cystitidis DSM 20524]SNV69487.1 Uncharacterised protein [Corynebacterium cystitidis]